ncbi:hypothetical protein D3C87_1965460 [compost metagenome]
MLRKKPPTIRPEPNTLSTVVVIDTTLPIGSTMTMWVVPAGSWVLSGPTTGAPLGRPKLGAGPAVSPISLARSAT